MNLKRFIAVSLIGFLFATFGCAERGFKKAQVFSEKKKIGRPKQKGGRKPRPSPGLPHRILSASSSDGLTWVKEYNVIIDPGSVPEVIQLQDGRFMIYYCGGDDGYMAAISSDGINFTKQAIWVDGEKIPGLIEPKRGLGADPDVVTLPDGGYRMYFTGYFKGDPAQNPHGYIGSAISPDGIHWRKEPGKRFERARITDPDVIKIGEVWRMYYSIGSTIYSASSADGLNFVADDGVRLEGSGVSSTLKFGDIYRMYYHVLDKRIHSAISTDGLRFSKEPGMRVGAGSPGSLDEYGVEAPSVIKLPDGTYRMYYVSPKTYKR